MKLFKGGWFSNQPIKLPNVPFEFVPIKCILWQLHRDIMQTNRTDLTPESRNTVRLYLN